VTHLKGNFNHSIDCIIKRLIKTFKYEIYTDREDVTCLFYKSAEHFSIETKYFSSIRFISYFWFIPGANKSKEIKHQFCLFYTPRHSGYSLVTNKDYPKLTEKEKKDLDDFIERFHSFTGLKLNLAVNVMAFFMFEKWYNRSSQNEITYLESKLRRFMVRESLSKRTVTGRKDI